MTNTKRTVKGKRTGAIRQNRSMSAGITGSKARLRKPYMTKKRKKEYDQTYKLIEELWGWIFFSEIEMETFKKNGAMDEYTARLERKKYYERELEKLKEQGWDTDRP